jgi:hypothetical protein
VTQDKALRPYKLWYHQLAASPPADTPFSDRDPATREFNASSSAGSSGRTADGGEGDGSGDESLDEFVEIDRPNDTLIYTELDERFNLHGSKSTDHRWVVFSAGSSETAEVHICDARCGRVPQLLALDDARCVPEGTRLPPPKFKCLRPREQKVEYSVESFHGK